MEKNKMPTTSWISVLVTPCRCSRKRPVPDSGGRQPPSCPARSESKPNEAARNSVSVDVGEQSDVQQAYPLRYAKKEVPDFCTLNSSFASRSPSEYCRQNGFELPLNLFQLLSWLLFLAVVVLVYLLLAFSFSVATIISLGTLFFVIVTVTGYAAIAVTRSDPSDERIAKHWELPNKGCSTHVGPGEVICDLCGPIDPRSKHCRVCNKCVAQFDHHCKWLNNCIGEVNYKMFFVLITSVALLTLVAVSLALAVVIKNVQSDSVRNYWEQRLGYFSPAGLYTLVTLTFILNLPLFVLDVQLLFLHVYLVFVGITTYEYITRRVQEPPPEDSADPDVSATRCCADWVVIDRKRLRRARERFRRHKRSSSFSGSEADHKPEETTENAIAQPSDCTPAAIA